jgi:septum formation protein
MKILLGSSSPRRKNLLEQLGYDFEVVAIHCDENYPDDLKTENIAGFLSELKANSFREVSNDEILITADTIVALDGSVLGKPKDRREALEILQQLSGKMHEVYTGITIRTAHKTHTTVDLAKVYFEDISRSEAEFYINNHHPFDKAGSYGIQDWLGMSKISRIEGSFYTVMGLPTHLIYKLLHEII